MPERRRVLVWDSLNTASVLVAQQLRARGYVVDSIEAPITRWRISSGSEEQRIVVAPGDDAAIERALFERPLDGLYLFGDEQVRWLLARWERLPARLRDKLSPRGSLEVALSKQRSNELARELGAPTIPTERCASEAEVYRAAWALAGEGGEVIIKGEGSSGGSAVRALRVGQRLAPGDWEALTTRAGSVMVQPRLSGPRLVLTVGYERGVERASCGHVRHASWPTDFGTTAVGVTHYVEEAHEYTRRLFGALAWNGPANIEYRQDLRDGRWYFIEINPRIGSSIGLQARAGVDIVSSWAEIFEGRGAAQAGGSTYRSGVGYWWAVNTITLALRRPDLLPWAQLPSMGSDWAALDSQARLGVLRVALWQARQGLKEAIALPQLQRLLGLREALAA